MIGRSMPFSKTVGAYTFPENKGRQPGCALIPLALFISFHEQV
jgi:hypothetical protein